MASNERTPGTGLTRTLDDWARREDATVSIGRHGPESPAAGEWSVMAVFGQEAPDSPMAGGAIHGLDEHLSVAIEQALSEAKVNPCAECGWEQTCEEGCHS